MDPNLTNLQICLSIIRDAAKVVDENYKTAERFDAMKRLKSYAALLPDEL